MEQLPKNNSKSAPEQVEDNEKEKAMNPTEKFNDARKKSCLEWLKGFSEFKKESFFYAVDWPMDDEAEAKKFLSDAGVGDDIKKSSFWLTFGQIRNGT